jgi:hypothetical protein
LSAEQKENTKILDIGIKMETSPRKSFSCVSVHCGMSKSSSDRAERLLKLCAFKLNKSPTVTLYDWKQETGISGGFKYW